jgi:hypothetical protein
VPGQGVIGDHVEIVAGGPGPGEVVGRRGLAIAVLGVSVGVAEVDGPAVGQGFGGVADLVLEPCLVGGVRDTAPAEGQQRQGQQRADRGSPLSTLHRPTSRHRPSARIDCPAKMQAACLGQWSPGPATRPLPASEFGGLSAGRCRRSPGQHTRCHVGLTRSLASANSRGDQRPARPPPFGPASASS